VLAPGRFLYLHIISLHMILSVRLLHGPSFGAYWVAGVGYTRERVPEGLSAAAQTHFCGTPLGPAGIVGGVPRGYLV
jgi:hypothetical protein